LTVSRREFLGLAGIAAATVPSVAKGLGSALLGRVEFALSSRRVAVRLAGRDRWVIDTRRFGGSPKLKVTRGEGRLRVELTGARYPGTAVPADMVCDFRKALAGWRMKIKFALGGSSREMPLGSFLAGAEPVRAKLRMAATGCQLSANSRLTLGGSAKAEFLPNWTLRLEGREIASLSGVGRGIASDAVTLALLDAGAPSLMQKPLPKRTLIVLDRGAHKWAVDLAPKKADRGRLVVKGSPFTAVEIEATEGNGSAPRRALLARGDEETDGLAFQPAPGLMGEEGGRFELGLRNARYAVAFDGGGEQAVLLADFHKEPSWLHTNGCSLRLGHAPDNSVFEMHSRKGRVQRLRCEPALLAFAAPLPDAIVEAAPSPEGTRIAFVADGTRLAQGTRPTLKRLPTPVLKKAPTTGPATTGAPPAASTPVGTPAGATRVPTLAVPKTPAAIKPPIGEVGIKPGIVGVLALSAPPVTVIRPDDLLCLTFEFINIKLQAGGTAGAMQLVRQATDKPAYIIVKFPPQNIVEQAFWEASDSQHPKPILPPLPPPIPPPPPDPSGDEASMIVPPVFAMMAQPSRLVFAVPMGTNSIDYSLQALLDWGKYTPSVSPNAAPPPAPPRLIGPAIERAPVLRKPLAPSGTLKKPSTLRIPGVPHFLGEDLTLPQVGAQLPVLVKPGGGTAAAGTAQPAGVKPSPQIIAPIAPGILLLVQKPSEPTPQITAIEAPYRLILSPHAGVGWAHSPTAVSSAPDENQPNRFELWHTRMGVRRQDGTVDEENDWYRTLRAIWTPDYVFDDQTKKPKLPGKPNEDQIHNNPSWPNYHPGAPNPDGFRMSLSRDDRCQIVWLTGDATIRKDFPERVVRANRFMLSALGAWMDTRYAYDLDAKGLMSTDTYGVSMDLLEWTHKAAMGRDSYVRVVYAGYLFPFGHRAALIKVTERKILHGTKYGPIAALRQRAFIVVREPVKTYRNTGLRDTRVNPPNLVDRQMPFTTIEITSLVTPSLDIPVSVDGDNTHCWYCFWANVGGQGYPFHVRATDTDTPGKVLDFKAPMIFVSRASLPGGGAGVYQNLDLLMKVKDNYDKSGRATSDMAGQKAAFADPRDLGDTRLEVQNMTFSAYIREAQPPEGTVGYVPIVAQAGVRIPAAEMLMKAGKVPQIAFAGPYVQGAANTGKVFAGLVDAVGFAFPSDKSGGLVTPDLSITGLSGSHGPIGGALDKFADSQFDPIDYFKNAMPKLLGTVSLASIIDAIFDQIKVPGLTHEVEQENGIPTGITVEFKWEPAIKPWPSKDDPFLGMTQPIFDHLDPGKADKHVTLIVHAKVHVSLKDGGSSQAMVEAKLSNFGLNLLPVSDDIPYFVKVTFKELKFIASDTQKPDVSCDLGDFRFGGPLKFIDTLRSIIPLDGFKDPPYLDVDTSGIKIGYTLEIPSVGVGVFSLTNLSIGAGVNIPWLGSGVTLRFEFCTKESPFCLSVSIFGGGGFFGCELGIDGLKLIEASFEFGGSFSFDIGVASGGAHIMAGVYFKLAGSEVTLEGYVRLGGNLSVLGLIRISIEFYMSIKYISTGNQVLGRAEVSIEIEILFFSFSVTLSVERRFAGSSSAWLPESTRLAMLTDSPEGYAELPKVLKPGARPGGVKPGLTKPSGGGTVVTEKQARVKDTVSADDWKEYCAAFG
jgi:hypothetical protein